MNAQSMPAPLCRDITAEEIASYRDNGWVLLPGFLNTQLAGELLSLARERMGENGEGNVSDYAGKATEKHFYNPEFASGLGHPVLRRLLFDIGRNSKALAARANGTEMRYFADLFAPKLPASGNALQGNIKTLFHQDYTNWALDRSGGMTFWIALTDLPPESGTMSFVSGSHHLGAMGHYRSYGVGDALTAYPELVEKAAPTKPLRFAPGDATVHSNLCIHGASENRTAAPRWVYTVSLNPADTRWNGAWTEVFDTTGMKQYQLLDDERFPVISVPE